MQQIYYKKNELFEVEFYKDKECTEAFDFKSEMTSYFKCNVNFENLGDPNNFYKYHNKGHYYIEFVNNDLTPLFYLPSDIQLFTPYIANIDKINGFLERKNIGIQSLDDTTPNLSKYIPEDNAVLFLSDDCCEKYMQYFQNHHISLYANDGLDKVTLEGSINAINEFVKNPIKKLTIFLHHGTQSELQKANEVAEELKEKYGFEEVNLFALHNFLKLTDAWKFDLAETLIPLKIGDRKKHITIKTLDNTTPNLSKYIPEDNAVLFLSGEQGRQYGKLFQLNWFYHFVDEDYETSIDCQFINQSSVSESMQESEEMLLNEFYNLPKNIIPSKQFTIFLPHGTQSELQKAEEVEKELKEKYGVEEVNLFALHCFVHKEHSQNGNPYTNYKPQNGLFKYKRTSATMSSCKYCDTWDIKYECCYDFNKIITTNSTGILKPEDSNERLQVIDCKEIFEEYLKENN